MQNIACVLEGTKLVFDALSQKKNLQSLNVSTNKLGDDRAVFVATLLKTNPTLKTLDIRSNAIGSYFVIFSLSSYSTSLIQ
jgi:Leucine-rich repeat (LRR) protein